MKRASAVTIAGLLCSIAATGVAAPCFLPTEIEADQAIRLRTNLLVVSQQCKDPTYSRFIERNGDTLAAYEQLLQERFERDRGPDALATYLTQIESAENERAARTPSYCADAFELVALANGMRPDGLRSYAAQHAEAARGRYAICTDLGNPPPPPAAIPIAVPPPAPPPAPPPPPAALAPLPVKATLPAPLHETLDDALVADLAASDLARQLDPVDRRQLNEALQRTLETAMSGHTNGWRNEFSRNAGTVVASPAFKNPAGQWCRHLVETITILRETRSGNGTACRNVDGTWDLVP